MSKQIKTAEEILIPEWNNYKINGMSFKTIALVCMERYAEQFKNTSDSVKAKKWDDLMEAVGVIYDHEDEEGGDLLDVGEIAAIHLGYL